MSDGLRIAAGFKAHSGWAVLVVISESAGDMKVIDRRRIELVELACRGVQRGGAHPSAPPHDAPARRLEHQPLVDFAQWTALAAPADPRSVQPMPAATLAHPLTVDAPVGSARFADQAAQQVTWMAKNGIEHAEIRVKPAELGPITVRIEMHKNEAIISFAVTQPETRAAVENALHKLQEMLADSGISLGQTSVGGQSMAGEERHGTQSGRMRVVFPAGPHGDGTPAGLSTGNRAAHVAARGLVDTFA